MNQIDENTGSILEKLRSIVDGGLALAENRLEMVSKLPNRNVAPLLVRPPEPRASGVEFTCKAPALIVVPPVWALALLKVSVPAPSLINCIAPLNVPDPANV